MQRPVIRLVALPPLFRPHVCSWYTSYFRQFPYKPTNNMSHPSSSSVLGKRKHSTRHIHYGRKPSADALHIEAEAARRLSPEIMSIIDAYTVPRIPCRAIERHYKTMGGVSTWISPDQVPWIRNDYPRERTV